MVENLGNHLNFALSAHARRSVLPLRGAIGLRSTMSMLVLGMTGNGAYTTLRRGRTIALRS
jgi:hypothetical protein